MRGAKPGHEIEIIEKKTGKRRPVTFNDEAATAIYRLLAVLGDRYDDNDKLFQGQRGPLTLKTVTRLVKQVVCRHQPKRQIRGADDAKNVRRSPKNEVRNIDT